MDLAVWRNTELHSFQHHPALSCTAGYTSEQPPKLQSSEQACTLGCVREGLPQVHACSFTLQHLHFCVKFFYDDYIFVAQAPNFCLVEKSHYIPDDLEAPL